MPFVLSSFCLLPISLFLSLDSIHATVSVLCNFSSGARRVALKLHPVHECAQAALANRGVGGRVSPPQKSQFNICISREWSRCDHSTGLVYVFD